MTHNLWGFWLNCLVKPKLKKVSFIKRYTNYILLDFIGHFFDPLDSKFNLGQKLVWMLMKDEQKQLWARYHLNRPFNLFENVSQAETLFDPFHFRRKPSFSPSFFRFTSKPGHKMGPLYPTQELKNPPKSQLLFTQ